MRPRIRANRFSCRIGGALSGALIVVGVLFSAGSAGAQAPENGPTNVVLQSWSFYDPVNWLDDDGYAPISFTNITYSRLGDP
jgi:hypothetical protein